MFQSTRLKLTAWYLFIIMVISIFFSVSIYRILTNEFERGFRRFSLRYDLDQRNLRNTPKPQILEPGYLEATKERIRFTLLYINLVILGVSGVAGYFLAGRTLKPIKIMMDEQNRFLGDASHELRTPLTALKTEIEVYFRVKNHTLSQANNLLKSNLEEINSLQTLSDNLLQLAKSPKPNKNMSVKHIALAAILNQANKTIGPVAKRKNIVILNKTHDEAIKGDEQALVQLLVILLDNAIKYSPKNSKVIIESKKEGNLVFVEVVDRGVGIDKKDIPHIFDRFYRVDLSRSKENVQGYGLGLAIAKKIVDFHQGVIEVKSKVGKGSVFTVQLPAGS